MFKMTPALVLVLLGLALAWTSGCDSQSQQEEFEDQAFAETPAGFTQRQDGENPSSVDGDDWRTAPLFENDVVLTPAFPNPVPSSGFVNIPISFQGLAPGTMYAYARDEEGRLRQELDRLSHSDFGIGQFDFSAGLLGGRGLHRVFILDGAGALVSYGDVMVE